MGSVARRIVPLTPFSLVVENEQSMKFTYLIIIIIIIAEMAVFNAAGYLIEERHRWPVITASP